MPGVEVVCANMECERDRAATLSLMDAYSADPMGDARPLSDYARRHLAQALRELPTALVLLAFQEGRPCGIVTCFRSLSTFAARPLLNISDFFVLPDARGRGIGTLLLEAAQREAAALGCCKLTLEVQQNNAVARAFYRRFGFGPAVYPADAAGGGSLYLVKPLIANETGDSR